MRMNFARAIGGVREAPLLNKHKGTPIWSFQADSLNMQSFTKLIGESRSVFPNQKITTRQRENQKAQSKNK